MIDFYERIGVPFGASEATIRLAIAKLRLGDVATADRASAILTSPQRRRAYDRLWMSLTRIGKVRALAKLNDAPFGIRPEYAEFRFRINENQAVPDLEAANEDQPLMGLKSILVLCALAVLVPLVVFFLLPTHTPRGIAPRDAPTQVDVPSRDASPAATEVQTREILPAQTHAPKAALQSVDAPPQLPALRALPLPKTGAGETRVNAGRDNWIQIKTSGKNHTWVRVQRPDGQLVASRFIRAADTLKVYLPLGTYVLKTATGREWFGDKDYFGPKTIYSKPEDTFPLNKPGEYWEVELILQVRGNLSQRNIAKAEFDAE